MVIEFLNLINTFWGLRDLNFFTHNQGRRTVPARKKHNLYW
nr:hypothetical protein [Methanobacterium formicicum]